MKAKKNFPRFARTDRRYAPLYTAFGSGRTTPKYLAPALEYCSSAITGWTHHPVLYSHCWHVPESCMLPKQCYSSLFTAHCQWDTAILFFVHIANWVHCCYQLALQHW